MHVHICWGTARALPTRRSTLPWPAPPPDRLPSHTCFVKTRDSVRETTGSCCADPRHRFGSTISSASARRTAATGRRATGESLNVRCLSVSLHVQFDWCISRFCSSFLSIFFFPSPIPTTPAPVSLSSFCSLLHMLSRLSAPLAPAYFKMSFPAPTAYRHLLMCHSVGTWYPLVRSPLFFPPPPPHLPSIAHSNRFNAAHALQFIIFYRQAYPSRFTLRPRFEILLDGAQFRVAI